MSYFYIPAQTLKESFKKINAVKTGDFDYLSFELIDSKLTLTTFSSQKNDHRISEARELIKIENIEIGNKEVEFESSKFCVSFKFVKNLATITKKGDICFVFDNEMEFVKIHLKKCFGCETESVHTISNFFVRDHFVFDLNLKEIQKENLSALEVWELVKDLKMESEEQKTEEIYQFQEIPELKDWHLLKPKTQKTLLKLVKDKYEKDLKFYPNILAQLITLDQELIKAKTQIYTKVENRLKQIRTVVRSKLDDKIVNIAKKYLKFKNLFTHWDESRSGINLNSDLELILNEIEILFKEFLKANSIVENQIILKPQNEFILVDYAQPTQKEIKTSKTMLLTGKIKVKRHRVKKIQPKIVIEVRPKKVLSKIDNLSYENKKTVIELPKTEIKKEVKEIEKPNQMYFIFENVIFFNINNMIFKIPQTKSQTPQKIELNQKYKQYFNLFIVFFLGFSSNLLNIIRQVYF
jgi:hypothetical protein